MKKILSLFLIWRVLLFVFLFLAISTLPLQKDFLGGGMQNYLKAPHLWSWVNFDGEHYLRIAREGYGQFSYFFFPVYPLLMRFATWGFKGGLVGYILSGLLISHISLLIGLIGLVRLIRMDYKRKTAFFAVSLLLFFPTSFYFGSFYTESLFFALVVWSFYFARTKRWIMAGVLGAILTATRVVGLALLPALLVEVWEQKREIGGIGDIGVIGVKKILGVLLVPMGLLIYMYYLKVQTGDSLAFFHSLGNVFGEQRSPRLILLPQVFYRYFFKILPNINYDYFPVVFTTWLEFITAVVFGVLGGLGILAALKRLGKFRLRASYAAYLVVGFLIPTLSGSFSSLPRYVLVLFPAFILSALIISKTPRSIQVLTFTLLFICLGIATSLFTRGYWVS